MSTTTRGALNNSSRTWPKRALALFLLIVVVLYALILFTGTKSLAPKLGIDLQGGTRVTLVPQGQEPTQDQLQQARTILEQRVNGMGVSGSEVVINGNTLVITVPGEDTAQAQAVGQTSKLLFRPVNMTMIPDVAKLPQTLEDMANRWVEYRVLTPEQADASLKRVIDALNMQNQQAGTGAEPMEVPTVSATPRPEPANSIEQGQQRDETIKMLLADRQSDDPTTIAAASGLLQCTPGSTEVDPVAGLDDPAKVFATCDVSNGQAYVLDPAPLLEGITDPAGTRLTGNEIDTDSPITGGLNPQTGQMEIGFAFKTGDGPNGSATWAKLTQDYLQQQVAITLDSSIISAPVIQGATPYGSATSITGSFTQEEATGLANNLKYGALPLSFTGENGEPGGTTEVVPPTLGKAALDAGLIAGLVGLVLVAAYVLFYFRAFGFISLLTLLGAGILTYGSIVLLGRWIGYSLDLSGIAGLVIGVGATADSFVVYYERIKDELLEGRTFRSATTKAWERARTTIVTGNAVTLIGSVIVYFLAIGEVKGFAFTLGLTTVFDLVVSFLIMAPLMQLAARRPVWAKQSMNGLGGIFALVEERRKEGHYAKPAKDVAHVSEPAQQTPAVESAAASGESVQTKARTTTSDTKDDTLVDEPRSKDETLAEEEEK